MSFLMPKPAAVPPPPTPETPPPPPTLADASGFNAQRNTLRRMSAGMGQSTSPAPTAAKTLLGQ